MSRPPEKQPLLADGATVFKEFKMKWNEMKWKYLYFKGIMISMDFKSKQQNNIHLWLKEKLKDMTTQFVLVLVLVKRNQRSSQGRR